MAVKKKTMREKAIESQLAEIELNYLSDRRSKAGDAERKLSIGESAREIGQMEGWSHKPGVTKDDELVLGMYEYVRRKPSPENVMRLQQIKGELDAGQSVNISFMDKELAEKANSVKEKKEKGNAGEESGGADSQSL